MEHQRLFTDDDKVELEKGSGDFSVLPFTNICDKGYQAKIVAWRCEKQLVFQPEWVESDR